MSCLYFIFSVSTLCALRTDGFTPTEETSLLCFDSLEIIYVTRWCFGYDDDSRIDGFGPFHTEDENFDFTFINSKKGAIVIDEGILVF
tara:strand:+ start:471 stop:734 length:264 start_codon:yes stop_codon:yes gene_type:complete